MYLPANPRQKLRNSGVFPAIDSFLVSKCKEISPKIHWRWFKVYWMIFTFIFISNKWIRKLWVLNEGQKMDEGVKYLKVKYDQFSLSFYRQLTSPLQILNAVLYKTRFNTFNQLETFSPMDIWRNSLTFRHQLVNSLKNSGGTTFAVEVVKFFKK